MQSLQPSSRLFSILFFLGCSLALTAQAYHPFPNKGTWYFERYGDMGQPIPGYEVFTTLGDTTLAGHTYKKLFLNATYYGALRDSAKQVYYRAVDDTLEHLLYDFNKITGDTIIAPYPMEGNGSSCDTILINYEDTLLTEDGPRRRLNLFGCNFTDWIEGIGNTWWLTSPAYLGSVSGGTFLTCSFDSSQLVYALEGHQCTSSTNESVYASDILLFPNPTSGPLTVAAPYNQLLSVRIFDIAGKEMLHFPRASSDLDISSLPDGVYCLLVQSKSHRKIFKVVKLSNK